MEVYGGLLKIRRNTKLLYTLSNSGGGDIDLQTSSSFLHLFRCLHLHRQFKKIQRAKKIFLLRLPESS